MSGIKLFIFGGVVETEAEPVTIPAQTTVCGLMETYFCRYSHKAFPPTQDGCLMGCFRMSGLGRLAAADKIRLTAGDLAKLKAVSPVQRP
ncbi:MAG: hypothetical protein ACX93P_08225 [Roseovarius sp.]